MNFIELNLKSISLTFFKVTVVAHSKGKGNGFEFEIWEIQKKKLSSNQQGSIVSQSVGKCYITLTVGSYPCLFCCRHFVNKRQLLCQFEVNVKLSCF